MNKEFMLELADRLEEHQRTGRHIDGMTAFNMADYADPRFDDNDEPCGTACCIAGSAVALSIEKGDDPEGSLLYWGGIYERAQELLGLTDLQADRLFLGHWEPASHPGKNGFRGHAGDAAKVLRKLAAGKRVLLRDRPAW